jgi:hypothetical protein
LKLEEAMEWNEYEEKKVMINSRQPFPAKLMIDQNNWRM